MTFVDWLIVVFTVLLALRGYTRGFLVGALSLVGFGVGAYVGTRIGPLLLPHGAHSPYAPLFGLAGALLAGGVLASGLEGLGWSARRLLRIPGFDFLDGVLGAGLTACVALGIVWIIGAIVLQSSGSTQLRADVQRSAILRALNNVLPPSSPILNALARIDPLPSVTGPPADVPAPSRGILATAGVRAASASVVRVLGSACGLGIEGSGWVAAPGLVVTNAHVVAGETDTVVQVHGTGPSLRAVPVLFDSGNDIAVLHVYGLSERPLALAAAPHSGTAAAILGYPLDGPFNRQPGRLGQTRLTRTENAYGQGPVLRQVASLRGLVRPGNSGGPMVDRAGHVVATVFAAITNAPPGQAGGFAVPDTVVRHELDRALVTRHVVGSGHCAD
ncbi:MAG TPA: MarP family serine protease [Solirubrobacteraceae bacterium]|jgi:S1-C subfamily serine protease|nr:MarP family serine protease [Solirubrobacteraceae bacterium]